MADIAIQIATDKGITPTFSAVTADDTFRNTGKEFLHIKNNGASSITVTIAAQKKCNFGELHNEIITINAGSEKIIGAFDVAQFNDNYSKVHVNFSAITDVVAAVIQL